MARMKDFLIDIVEPLADETGYDFDFLMHMLLDELANDIHETTEAAIEYFRGVTLEFDW